MMQRAHFFRFHVLQLENEVQAAGLVNVVGAPDRGAGDVLVPSASKQHEAVRQKSYHRMRLHQDEDDRVQGASPRED